MGFTRAETEKTKTGHSSSPSSYRARNRSCSMSSSLSLESSRSFTSCRMSLREKRAGGAVSMGYIVVPACTGGMHPPPRERGPPSPSALHVPPKLEHVYIVRFLCVPVLWNGVADG